MKTFADTVFAVTATLAATAGLAVATAPRRACAQTTTRVVTPPGSTTRVTTTPAGDAVITVSVNSQPVTFEERRAPVMQGGRVLVPLRGVVEKLGGEIKYEAQSRVITGAHPGAQRQFRLRVGSRDALVNGKTTTLDSSPRVVNGTTYVPLRFVSEAMGARVVWDNAQRAVVITSSGDAAATAAPATPTTTTTVETP